MSLVVVGINERDVDLNLLERVSISESDLPKALRELLDSPHLDEAVIVSTCMRTEVYAVLERFHDGLDDIRTFFASRLGSSESGSSALDEELFVAYDEAAAHHLFEVATGIDSAVLGEGEILRQVRRAAERANIEHASGPVLGELFRHAFEVGKRARTETSIARGLLSLAHVAVAMGEQWIGKDLRGKHAVVVGAGEMGEGILDALTKADVADVVIANRSRERAAALAKTYRATAIGLSEVERELDSTDILFSATATEELRFGIDQMSRVVARREGRANLLVIDAAIPRDVDPRVRDLAGVTLIDLDDMREFADANMRQRRAEVGRVEEIITDELERYRMDARGRSTAPLIAALYDQAEQMRRTECDRVRSSLSEREQELLERETRLVMKRFLHGPVIELKQSAGTARGERLAEALRSLFSL